MRRSTNSVYGTPEEIYTPGEVYAMAVANKFLKIMRSKEDPSIIAVHVGGDIAIKIKKADIPYNGESNPGSRFNFNLINWDYVKDLNASQYAMAWMMGRLK